MRFRLSSFAAAASLLLALLLSGPAARAQDFRGSILGVVSDAQGAAIPGVSVTVTNLGTNVAGTVITDGRGQYRAPYLISGNYSVQVQLQGFKSVVRKPIEVRVGDSITVDVTLQAGGIEEVVEVVASTPILDTNSGVTGQVIDGNQIRELPLADRHCLYALALAPGLADSSDLHFAPPDGQRQPGRHHRQRRPGRQRVHARRRPQPRLAEQHEPGEQRRVVGFSPPSDAIAEFEVQTNAFDAQAATRRGPSSTSPSRAGRTPSTALWPTSTGTTAGAPRRC